VVYDVQNKGAVSNSIGLAYDDECFSFSAVYSATRDQYSDLVSDQEVMVRVNLRTLGNDRPISQLSD
jgi:lipopolysaccharide assembly outer membrane protein LptD (OstA)